MSSSCVTAGQNIEVNSASADIDTPKVISLPVIDAAMKRLWVKKTWISRKVVVAAAEESDRVVASPAKKKAERQAVARILTDSQDDLIKSSQIFACASKPLDKKVKLSLVKKTDAQDPAIS